MSLYRFKSRETADLVMLEPDGKRILQLLGKDPTQPGIVTAAQLPQAIEALKAAVHEEEALQQMLNAEAAARGEPAPALATIGLRTRSAPFIEMLQRCQQAEVDVVWGV